MAFLRKRLKVSFGTIKLTKYFNSKDFQQKLHEASGKYDKNATSFIIHKPWLSLVPAEIIIDLHSLLINPESFVVNLVLNILEELLHRVYPIKTEKEIKAIMYPLAEEFLGVKLPEEYKSKSIDDAET